MAIPTVTGTVGSGYTAAGTSLTYSHTSNGDVLYVVLATTGEFNATSVTYNGVALSVQMDEPLFALGFSVGAVWSLVAPVVGTHDVVITIATSASIRSGAMNINGGPSNGSLSIPTARWTFTTEEQALVVPAYSESLTFAWTSNAVAPTSTDASTVLWEVTGAMCSSQPGGDLTEYGWDLAEETNQSFSWGFAIPSGGYVLSGGNTQLWMGRNSVASNQVWGLPTGRGAWSFGSPIIDHRGDCNILTSGTVRSLAITKDVAPGSGKSWTYTVYKNGIPTGLAVTIADAATSGSASFDISVYPYDRLFVGVTGAGGPAGATLGYCCEFETGARGFSVYGTHILDGMDGVTDTVTYQGPLFSNTAWDSSAPKLDYILNLCGAAGVLTEYAVMSQQGAADQALEDDWVFTFVLYKNGVAQDGTAGTPDTTITVDYLLGDVRAVRRAQFSLPIAVGDELYVTGTITGADVSQARYAVSALCLSSTAGEFTIGGAISTLASGTQPYWASPTASPAQNVFAAPDEPTIACTMGPLTQAFSVTGIVARLDAAPTGTKSYTFSNRKNGASPAGVTSLVITGSTTKDSAAGDLAYVAGDTLNMQIVPADSPSGNEAAWALRGFTVTPPVSSDRQTIRRMRIFNLPFNENKWLFLRRLELFLEQGQGLTTGQGSDPQIMISLSRDGGQTFGPERWVSAGKRGAYTHRSFLLQLGRYRNGAVKIVVTDPIPWNLSAAFGQLDEGLS